jgi:hypothetical protein
VRLADELLEPGHQGLLLRAEMSYTASLLEEILGKIDRGSHAESICFR